MRRLLGVLLLLLIPRVGAAQIVDNYITTALPMTCATGQLAYKTTATAGLYICTATNTWTLLATQGGAGGGAAWGAITGTLGNQTDLQTAIDGKLATDGTAAASTKLATARTINGVNFDGTGNITVTAAGSTLSDTVTVAKGGTGLATLTAHALYVGNGTSAPTALAVCGTGTYVRGSAGADPVCSTLTLPNAMTTGDTLIATGTNAAGVVAAGATGTYFRGAGAGTAPIWSTVTLPNALTTGDVLIATGTNAAGVVGAAAIGQVFASKGTGTAPAWVTYALTHASPANQTGNATATFKMNGLGAAGCTITPTATGRVVFTITGSATNTTTADSVTWKLAYGTGTPPANAAAATGSVISATGVFKALTGMLASPFSVTSIATGLALNVAVWFDLQIAFITNGTASVTAIDCTAQET